MIEWDRINHVLAAHGSGLDDGAQQAYTATRAAHAQVLVIEHLTSKDRGHSGVSCACSLMRARIVCSMVVLVALNLMT